MFAIAVAFAVAIAIVLLCIGGMRVTRGPLLDADLCRLWFAAA